MSILSIFTTPCMVASPVSQLTCSLQCTSACPRTVDPCENCSLRVCEKADQLPTKYASVSLTEHALKVCHYDRAVHLLFNHPSDCSSGSFDFHPHTPSFDAICAQSYLSCFPIEVCSKDPTTMMSYDNGDIITSDSPMADSDSELFHVSGGQWHKKHNCDTPGPAE